MTVSKLRSALALGLLLWCAGAGCLAHGMAMASAAPARNSKPAKSNLSKSEMAMNGHACCKARHRALQNETAKSNSDSRVETFALPEDPPSDGAASCCPLTSGSFVTVSRSQTDDNKSSPLADTGLPEQGFTVQFAADRKTPLRLPSHKHTYLTCCAFLI